MKMSAYGYFILTYLSLRDWTAFLSVTNLGGILSGGKCNNINISSMLVMIHIPLVTGTMLPPQSGFYGIVIYKEKK